MTITTQELDNDREIVGIKDDATGALFLMTTFDRQDDVIIFEIMSTGPAEVQMDRHQLAELNSHITQYLERWK